MTPESSGLSILLTHLGINRRPILAGTFMISVFEVTIIGFAIIQAFAERALGWSPVVLFLAVWIVWTWWHSWLFPRRRLRYLARFNNPYRRAFVTDIYPWVSIGFSQMWRPLINGDTLERFLAGHLKLSLIPVTIGLSICFASLGIIILAIQTIGIHNASFLREFVEPDAFRPVQTGIYGAVMHPLFWSGIAYSCGLAVVVLTPRAILIAALNTAYGLLYIRLENRRLSRIFGTPYDSYCSQVYSVIPWRRSLVKPWSRSP
jgi:protein-S-isoprenylcysteine O-methyltransferase Ste14